jgi:annexin A7/11
LQGNRDERQSVNHQMAQEDAQRLYQAGEGRLGTDESCFNMILATRSFPQLKATMEAYSRVGLNSPEDVLFILRYENA